MNATASAPRTSPRPIGPLFGLELLRLSRGRGLAALKVFIGAMLLVVLWSVWQQRVRVDGPGRTSLGQSAPIARESAAFAERVVRIYLIAQLVLVLVLAPILAASAIVEEKTRKTLEFLLATDLSRREIMLGKFFARLVQLSTLLLVGLPILAIVRLFGGIDVDAVIACHLLAFDAMFLLSAISLYYAVMADQLKTLLPRLWLFAALPLGVLLWYGYAEIWKNPLAIWDLDGFLGRLLPFSAGCLLVGGLFLRGAIRKLSRAAIVFAPDYRRGLLPSPFHPHKRYFWEAPPAISGHPLLWKEANFGGSRNRFVRLLATAPGWAWGIAVGAYSFAIYGEFADGSSDMKNLYADILHYAGMASAVLMVLLVASTGLHAASAIAKERQQQTLIDLLMIPGGRAEILRAKWYGSFRRGRGVMWGLIPLLALAALSESMGVLSGIVLMCAAMVFCTAGIGFGLWLSVRHDSIAEANGRWLMAFLGWLAVSWLVVESFVPPAPPTPTLWAPISAIELDDSISDHLGPIVSPLHLWKSLCLSDSLPDPNADLWGVRANETRFRRVEQLVPAQIGLILWSIVGLSFYLLALRRLERDGRF